MASDWKGFVKHGWHPEKEGTSLKGQVKGLVGRGDKSTSQASRDHVSAPVSSLRDPSTFAPPPRRVGDAGGPTPASGPGVAATPNTTIPETGQTQQYGHPTGHVPAHQPMRGEVAGGFGGQDLPPPPPLPTPPPYSSPVKAKGPPPALPPLLPPRDSTGNSSSPVAGQQQHSPLSTIGNITGAARSSNSAGGFAPNQGAVDRLGAAGISVPGLGIGAAGKPSASQATPILPPQRSGGTTLAQEQAALRTASALQKDPSSVSFSEVRGAASTANNFRERHGDQVATGVKTANEVGLGKKFGNSSQESASTMGQFSGVLAKKKAPPPPPPPKKTGLSEINGQDAPPPPPVPLATRPKYG